MLYYVSQSHMLDGGDLDGVSSMDGRERADVRFDLDLLHYRVYWLIGLVQQRKTNGMDRVLVHLHFAVSEWT